MLSERVQNLELETIRLRDENKNLRELLGKEPEKPMDCKNCRFFMQHYVKCGTMYVMTNAGHCTQGKKFKDREPECKACRYFAS